MQRCCIKEDDQYICNMVALGRFFSRLSWDVVGFSASFLCAVHCALLPMLVLFSSYGGDALTHNHTIENAILFFSTVLGTISIIPSFRKHHQKVLPVITFFAGIFVIILSRFQDVLFIETVMTTCGAITVALSHLINWRLCRPFHIKVASKEI